MISLFFPQICTEAIDNVRTVVSLTREKTFVDEYSNHVDSIYRCVGPPPKINVQQCIVGNFVLTQLYFDEFKMGQSVCKCGKAKISQSRNTPVYQLWDYFTGLGSRELPCMVLYLLCLSASCISPTLPRLLTVPT